MLIERETESYRKRERNCLPCIAYFTVLDRLALVLAIFRYRKTKRQKNKKQQERETESYI